MHPRRRHHLHARVPRRVTCPAEQQARARLFAGQGALDVQPPRMDGGVAQALTAALWGLAVAGMFFERGAEVAPWLAVGSAFTWAEVRCLSSPLASQCHDRRRPSWRRTPLLRGHHGLRTNSEKLREQSYLVCKVLMPLVSSDTRSSRVGVYQTFCSARHELWDTAAPDCHSTLTLRRHNASRGGESS